MFWERSDTTLADDQLKALRSIETHGDDARDAVQPYLGAVAICPIGGGTFNHVWRTAPYSHWTPAELDHARIVRLNVHPSPNHQALHLEQWVCNEALSRAFPTPRIVHVDTSRQHSPYPFQIIEYVDGVSLRSADEPTVRKVLGQLGAALARLHAAPIGDRYGRVGLGTLPDWDLFVTWYLESHIDYCLDHDLITPDQAGTITTLFKDYLFLDWAPSLLHGDLSYDNILIDSATGDLKSVIDWEDAVLGDPIFELAGLATFHPESRHSAFLDTYYAGRTRPDDFEHRFWVYYLRIALAKAVHRHRFGYVAPDRPPDHQHPDDRIALALSHLKDLS